MQDVASGISDLFGVGADTVGDIRTELLDAISDLLRVGVCTVEALCGSIFVTVLCGVELDGNGDEVSPKSASDADTRFCGVLLVCLASSLSSSSSSCGACVLSSKSYSCSV